MIIEAEFPDLGSLGPVQTVAFSIEHEGEERLVVAIEARANQNGFDPAKVAQVIRSLLILSIRTRS